MKQPIADCSARNSRLIRRVKGAKKLGIRLGNWFMACQAKALLDAPDLECVRGKRDRAMLALLLGCDYAVLKLFT